MKILKNIAIKKIDRDTRHLFYFIDGLPNDSIKNHYEIRCALGQLNNFRNLLGLPGLFISPRPIPMPEVKPPKNEEPASRKITINEGDCLIVKADTIMRKDDFEAFRRETIDQINEGVLLLTDGFTYTIWKRDYLEQAQEDKS